MRATRTMILSAILGGTIALPAPAQTEGTGDRVVRAFAECRRIAEPARRLDCFDKAAGALETAVKAKDVQIVDRADMRRARRSLFGFTLPRIDLFGGGRDGDREEPEFTEINSTVAGARAVANNRVEIRLADESNAVWQTTDPMPFPPKKGAKIRIRKGTLGSYFMVIDGTRVRGTRLR